MILWVRLPPRLLNARVRKLAKRKVLETFVSLNKGILSVRVRPRVLISRSVTWVPDELKIAENMPAQMLDG